ncbi:pentapeptide repeat-containing protein [Streptomyces melanogenes]|uniref:pentapeptide repeat-containing protein n=1 Tax=Streptomyces melanogenes TaxID=67326 RepID=UPI00167F08A4|nr:pentapeptide repeat-containing protein [Streptomyces melanogenes]GGP56913.1 hypothetical protein GCM10010278_37550 [Streptomyces melanogenes]
MIQPCAHNLTGTDFSQADLTKAFLNELEPRKTKFCDRSLLISPEDSESPTPAEEWQPTNCAVLRNASFGLANLSAVDLRGADLQGALIPWVNLSKTDLREANLTGADLTGADLTGAKLTGARMAGAILTGAKGLPSS